MSKVQQFLGQNYKWWYLLLFSFKQGNLKLRGFILGQASSLIEIVVTLYIWGYFTGQKPSIITYFFVGFIIQRLAWNTFLGEFSKDIVTGKINNLLITPINLMQFMLVKEIGNRFISNLISAGLILLLLPLYIDLLVLPSAQFLAFVPLIIIIAFMIDFGGSFLLGLIAFWDNDYNSLIRLVASILTIMTGIRVPFEYLPSPWSSILSFNPYAWMSYQPMQIYLGRHNWIETIVILIAGLGWCSCLWLCSSWVLRLGLRRNESVGL